MRLCVLGMALLLAGCGGGQGSPQVATADWEERSGPTWEAYVQGFRTGWTEGCEAASDSLRDEEPSLSMTRLCGHPPAKPEEGDVTPDAPPYDDPEGTGHSDGLVAGCEDAFRAAGRHGVAVCATGELIG